MKTNKVPKLIAGIITLLVTVAIIISIFTIFITTVKNTMLITDTAYENHGNTYQVLSDGKCYDVVPKYNNDIVDFGKTNITAVKTTCIIPTIENPTDSNYYINTSTLGIGTEIFVDDKMIYSNIDLQKRDSNGFLVVTDEYISNSQELLSDNTLSIPSDFLGKKLTEINYFSPDSFLTVPLVLFGDTNDFSASTVTSTFIPIFIVVMCGIMALLLCAVLLYGISNEKYNFKIIFLILFFVMLLINEFYSTSLALSCALLDIAPLQFFNLLYIIPLIMYTASNLTKWNRLILFIAAGGAVIFYSVVAISQIIFSGFMITPDNSMVYFLLFLLTLVLIIIEFKCNNAAFKKYANIKSAVVFAVIIIVGITFFCYIADAPIENFFKDIYFSIISKNFTPLCHLLAILFAMTAFVTLIVNFITDIVNSQKKISVLNERSRYALQSYQMLLVGENETRAARHEMAHHMNAIAALLDNNDSKRAAEYIHSVSENLHNLPKLRYCENLLVNSVAGAYVEQAKQENIKVTCAMNVPEEIGIADKDLCVLLENMLDNAIEACKKVDGEKLIDININYNGNFLYVGCENSCADNVVFNADNMPVTSKADAENHGYGVATMKMIAEKYNSILITKCDGKTFSVKTNLNCTSKKEKEH